MMAVSAPSVASAANFSDALSPGWTSTRKALGSVGVWSLPLSLVFLVVAMVYPFKSEFMLL